MRKRDGKLNSQRGSVSIEATIALTAFLFMFMMLYSLINICRGQAQIQIAINSVAKEISQYSYLYGRAGLAESIGGVQKSAEQTKGEINGLTGKIVEVFNGVQSIGDNAGAGVEKVSEGEITAAADSWNNILSDFNNIKENGTSVINTVKEAASDPKKLMFSLTRLVASEGLELAKSRAIAVPVCKGLIQKHLKRSSNDTADAFCRSIGVVKGTYFSETSFFNGLDFSQSTLFPYGTDDINIVVTYEVKLLQLLPIETKFRITQRAKTKGWLLGDGSKTPTAEETAKKMAERGESYWNDMEPRDREDFIRDMGLRELLSDPSFKKIRNNNNVQVYDSSTSTFYKLISYNPLKDCKSMDELDKAKVKETLEHYIATIKSTTDNIQYVDVYDKDSHGNRVKKELKVEGEVNNKLVITIPEDDGLKSTFEEILKEIGSDVEVEINANYGKVFVPEPKAEQTNDNDSGDT